MPGFIRRIACNPLWIIGAFWPMALATPYLPGLPRPSPSGLPWRQEILIAILLSATLALLTRRARDFKTISLNINRTEIFWLIPAIAFALWNAASVTWAVYKYSAAHQAFAWGTYLLFFALVRRVATHPRLLRASLVSLAALIWLLSLSCMVEFWGTLSAEATRTSTQFRYFGGFGEVVAVVIPLFATLALRLRRSKQAAFCGATAVVAWLAMLQALERAPIISASIALLMLAIAATVLKQYRPRSLWRVVLLVAALSSATLLQVAPSTLTQGRSSAFTRLQSTAASEPNTRVRLLFWGIGLEMFRAHTLMGVGANNYEIAYPQARAEFSKAHAGSSLITMHEEMSVERAHNEYVQILSELGVIGFALFAAFCAALTCMVWRAVRRSRSPLALGSACSMLAFAVSSGASSFSFRWMGSSLLFFFAVALVSHYAANATHRDEKINLTTFPARLVTMSGFVLALVIFCAVAVQATNSVLLGLAQRSNSQSDSRRLHQMALSFNPYDAATNFSYGILLYEGSCASDALPHLRYSVARGLNTSGCYALLASAETEAGENASAERTLADAASVYPRSVFLRVRHATALAEVGRMEEAQREYTVALALDERAARGWWQLINFGINAARDAAQKDSSIAKAGDLYPESYILPAIAQQKRHAPTAFPADSQMLRAFAP